MSSTPPVALAQRPPTPQEFEKFRLILSTYQDGTGMLAAGGGRTLPGWRDFERAIALTFNGAASENKDIFDVRLPSPNQPGVHYGVSCKMRRELNRIERDGRVTVEVSNSARKFWNYLGNRGIDQGNYKEYPTEVGSSLVEQVQGWHVEVSLEAGGDVDLTGSCYLVLSWNPAGWYQLHQFALELPCPDRLHWYFPVYPHNDIDQPGNHLNGDDDTGTLIEWYGESGGQLKYYPLAETAVWASEKFRLEPLPANVKHDVLSIAQTYFPDRWPQESS